MHAAKMESSLARGINSQVQRASPHAHTAGNLIGASLLATLGKNKRKKKKDDLLHPPFCFFPPNKPSLQAQPQDWLFTDAEQQETSAVAPLSSLLVCRQWSYLQELPPRPVTARDTRARSQTLHTLQAALCSAEALPKGRSRGEDTKPGSAGLHRAWHGGVYTDRLWLGGTLHHQA